jgi:hypothetical protein
MKKVLLPIVMLVFFLPLKIGFAAVLYDQYDNQGFSSFPSQDFETAIDNFDAQGADDFVVPAGETWNITEVDFYGDYSAGALGSDSFHVFIYQDAAGLPGSVVYTALNQSYSTSNNIDFVVTLSTPAVLTEGTYWVSVQSRMDYNGNDQWFWKDRSVQNNNPAAWQNPGDGFGTGCTDWNVRTNCLGSSGPDYVYRLVGDLIVSNCTLYGDDFNDGILSWTELKPIITETSGNLNLTPAPNKKKAAASSDPVFLGCQFCINTFEGVQFTGGALAKLFLNSNFIDKRNTLQLIIREGQDKAVLKLKSGGVTIAKAKGLFTFDPNTPYDISIAYDGTTVTASVNGSTLITMTPSTTIPSGIVELESRLQTTIIDSFCSNYSSSI